MKNTTKSFGDEQSAFPTGQGFESGMTLRDYFAAKAMEGYMSHYSIDMTDLEECREMAAQFYNMADVMIAVREAK